MPTKRPRTIQQHRIRSCYQVGCFLAVTLAMSTAQDSVTSNEKQRDDNGMDDLAIIDDNEVQRKHMLQQRQSIRQSHGKRYWNGLEENGVDLPLFGLSHAGIRRKVKLRKTAAIIAFSPDNVDSSLHATRRGRDDESSSSTKSRSKKSSNKGSNKGGKGGKGGKGPRPQPRPNPRPSQPSFDPPSPRPPTRPLEPTGSGACTKVITLDFLQLSAIPPALFVNPADPDEQTLGTRYIYKDGLFDQDTLDELIDSNVAGTCTRTQARVGNPSIGLQLGGGTCQFTYTLRDSRNREIVFTASGEVVDSLGGILSITGGSRSTLGAYGEVELLPVNLQSDGDFDVATGDFFLDPLFYVADATVIVPCDN